MANAGLRLQVITQVFTKKYVRNTGLYTLCERKCCIDVNNKHLSNLVSQRDNKIKNRLALSGETKRHVAPEDPFGEENFNIMFHKKIL